MSWLRQLFLHTTSFRNQQRLAILLVCSFVLIVSLVSSLAFDFYSFSRESRARLGALADIIAAEISAAVMFDDRTAIHKSLQALAADPAIAQLFVVDPHDRLIASYIREGTTRNSYDASAARLSELKTSLATDPPLQISPKVRRPIRHDEVNLGSILVQLDSSLFINKLFASCGIGLAILLISLFGSYLLARRLGRIITAPITSLANTMEEVSRTKDYTVRAEVHTVSELASLSHGFNSMLEEIALRDAALLERQERLYRLVNYDPLTGLPNRSLFRDRLAQTIRHAERSGEQLAVMFIDLDDFKLINDTHGHRVGDLLLVEVARRLEVETRDDDTLARLGGDEFIIIQNNIKSSENALQVGKKHLQNLLAAYQLDDKQLYVSASIGISLYPEHGESGEVLTKSADTAMYQAKKQGKNHVVLFTQALYTKASERLSLQSDLRRAVEQQEFMLCYQPRINLRNRSWSGAEALLRWHHPQHGMIMPSMFIALAEETGLIMELGAWVLNKACMQLQQWRTAGILLPHISVNISPLQFRRQNIVQLVGSAIAAAQICPQSLELEITESALMEDLDASIQTLRELQELGVRISIDDFGTGYSSLSHLRSLPVDILKIDRSFVMHADASQDDAQILSAIISMAHSLHLSVVAEGVETEAHQQLLQLHNCNEAQGYFYAKPMPADQVAAFLNASSIKPEPVISNSTPASAP